MDVRAEKRGRLHRKVRFSAAPVMGRNLLTQGHPDVRVRNVLGKFGPKSLCLCCFFVPDQRLCCSLSFCLKRCFGKPLESSWIHVAWAFGAHVPFVCTFFLFLISCETRTPLLLAQIEKSQSLQLLPTFNHFLQIFAEFCSIFESTRKRNMQKADLSKNLRFRVCCVRGQELNTNFFFSNFSGAPWVLFLA